MKRVMNLLVPVFVFAAVVALAQPVAMAGILYSEDFATTGGVTTDNGTPLANYPNWTYNENIQGVNSEARVDTAGILTLAGGGPGTYEHLTATITAAKVLGKPAGTNFDVSVNPLTVSAGLSGTSSTNPDDSGYNTAELCVGNLRIGFWPGYNAGGGAGLVAVYAPTLTTQSPPFVPARNDLYTTTITIVEDPTHTNYDIHYSISGTNGTYSNDIAPSIASIGPLDSIRLYTETGYSGASCTGYFSNFSVSQVPEPGTLTLLGSALAGLLCYAWRKRK